MCHAISTERLFFMALLSPLCRESQSGSLQRGKLRLTEVASGCLTSVFVTLGLTKAPVMGEQLEVKFLSFSHPLGCRGVLKVLSKRQKTGGRESTFLNL